MLACLLHPQTFYLLLKFYRPARCFGYVFRVFHCRGLSLFLGMAGSWLYGRDPVDELRYEDVVKELTEK